MDINIPAWLERLRLDPSFADRAYQESDPQLRARLKTAIAWRFSLEGELPWHEERTVTSADRAFCSRRASRPADAAVLFLPQGQQAPARLLAAVIPAILAQVPKIAVFCLGGPPCPANCLALELAGVEDIFVLPDLELHQRELATWLEDLGRQNGLRCLCLADENPALQKLLPQAAEIWREKEASRIGLARGASQSFKDILAWAHGASAVFAEANEDGQDFAACYAENDSQRELWTQCPQVYGPGLEACWLFAELNPAFFRRLAINAFLTDGSSHEQ